MPDLQRYSWNHYFRKFSAGSRIFREKNPLENFFGRNPFRQNFFPLIIISAGKKFWRKIRHSSTTADKCKERTKTMQKRTFVDWWSLFWVASLITIVFEFFYFFQSLIKANFNIIQFWNLKVLIFIKETKTINNTYYREPVFPTHVVYLMLLDAVPGSLNYPRIR